MLRTVQKEAQLQAFERFWQWWRTARDGIEVGLGQGSPESFESALTAQVESLHPGLTWEIAREEEGQFSLTLSGHGNFTLRKLTGAWAKSAPSPSQGWHFLPNRTGSFEAATETLQWEGIEISMEQLRLLIEVDDGCARAHLGAFHPAFAQLTDQSAKGALALALDSLLGEDEIERWIGRTELLAAPAPDSLTARELQLRIIKLADPERDPGYAAFEATLESGDPVVGIIETSMKRLDHLEHEWHLEVSILYLQTREDGIPVESEFRVGVDLENELIDALKPSQAIHFGRLMHSARRHMFFYVRDREWTQSALDAWIPLHPDRKVKFEWNEDPEWSRIREFEEAERDA